MKTVDISELYKNWYISILAIINLSKDKLLSNGYSEPEIKLIEDKFNSLLTLLNEGKIGGMILIARKV